MAFIDRLKDARLQKGFTQEQIAEKIGVAKSTYTGYERGTREPNVNTIGLLMDELGVDANYLWQDEMDSLGGSPMKLKYDEMQHIEKYRALDPHGKEMVDFTLQKEWERSTVTVKDNAIEYDSATAKAAHNDYETEPGEVEKMKEDVSILKRPE